MKYFFLALIALSIIATISCSGDDPDDLIEIVTVRDTIIVTQFDTSVVVDTTVIVVYDTTIVTQIDTIIQTIDDDSSVVVFCVRHAETESGNNPRLSDTGLRRAETLSRVLSNTDLAGVYTTNFNRTRQTADITASAQGLSFLVYNAFDIPGFAQNLLQNHKGESVLAVGHSNTTPELLNALTNSSTYSTFDEESYDNLFIVKVKINGKTDVFHLEYGENTP